MATILVTDRNKRSDSKRFLIFDTVAWRQPGFIAAGPPSALSRESSVSFTPRPYPLSREPSVTSNNTNNNYNNQIPNLTSDWITAPGQGRGGTTSSLRAVTIMEPLAEITKSPKHHVDRHDGDDVGGGRGEASPSPSVKAPSSAAASPMSSPITSSRKQPSSSSLRSGLLTPDGSKRGFIAKGAAPLRVSRGAFCISSLHTSLHTLSTHLLTLSIHLSSSPGRSMPISRCRDRPLRYCSKTATIRCQGRD